MEYSVVNQGHPFIFVVAQRPNNFPSHLQITVPGAHIIGLTAEQPASLHATSKRFKDTLSFAVHLLYHCCSLKCVSSNCIPVPQGIY